MMLSVWCGAGFCCYLLSTYWYSAVGMFFVVASSCLRTLLSIQARCHPEQSEGSRSVQRSSQQLENVACHVILRSWLRMTISVNRSGLKGFDGFCGWGGFAGGDSGHDYFFAERVPRAACGETSRWAGCGTSRSAAASCFALGRRPLNSAGNLACS